MKSFFTLFLGIVVGAHTLCAQQFEYFNGHKAQSGQVVYKIKAQPSLKSVPIVQDNEQIQFSELLLATNARSEIMFPQVKKPGADCHNCVDLTRVYRLTYDPQKISLTRMISLLRRLSFIEYAEPLYVDEFLAFVPNDTYVTANSQWFMETIQLFEAWDVPDGQGSPDVVIGIVDSGTEIEHEDLIKQIAVNTADPINGIDDDGDGYVDNFYGWDFGMDDNDPRPDGIEHGTYVTGLASAEVNNEKGIAGTGFRCRYLPVKIADKAGNLVRSYEGVMYAALQGCKVINCSWGGAGNYSEFAREVVQFVTFNCNALVVAAAGNSGNNGVFYPASYPFALSVAGSVQGDLKWPSSNYNYFVDVSSPTTGYVSTRVGNRYGNPGGGTSYAAPIVSGVAGLIQAKFPHYTAMQVGEQLRVNADDIYHIGTNANYRDQLGNGRVNALNALTNTSKPSIRIDSFAMRNVNAYKYTFERGDTLEVDLFCTNYLAALPNAVTLTLNGGSYFLGLNTVTIETLETLETKKCTFRFRINQTFSTGSGYHFKLGISSKLYSDFEYITLWFNPLNYDFEFGNFKATATANGTIGVYNVLKPSGNGLRYKEQTNMIYDAGLLLALNDSTTAAPVRYNYDYTTIQNPRILKSDSVHLLVESKYKAAQLGLDIDQYIYGWNGVDALIHEYRITNTSNILRKNIRAGVFADWIIGFQRYNMVRYIDSLQCAVISGVDEGGFLVGVMPLHYHESGLFAYDTTSLKIPEIPSQDSLSSQGIWKLLTSTKTTAGIGFDDESDGNVNTSSWCMIGSMEPQQIDTVRYAIIAGKTFNEILNTASLLHQRYVTDTTTKVVPCDTCPCDSCNAIKNIERMDWIQLRQNQDYIELHTNTQTQAYLRISAISGVIVEERFHDFAQGAARFATGNLPKGVYIVTAHNKNEFQTFTIVITN
ncbi:MAG: S8 family serine peptidase [Bacteroidetes bacterium]|nr:S8 family serine peptidase [Bacteroidota bacterium]